MISYRAVGIPPERILIIDPTGRVRLADKICYESSYTRLAMDMVDYLFPPLVAHDSTSSSSSSTGRRCIAKSNFTKPRSFSSYTYWRPPPPQVYI